MFALTAPPSLISYCSEFLRSINNLATQSDPYLYIVIHSSPLFHVFSFCFSCFWLFLKKSRLPHAAPHLDVLGVLEAWLPYLLLQMGFEGLLAVSSGERSYSQTLDRRKVLSDQAWPSMQLREKHPWAVREEGDYPPSQSDQLNQPWPSLGSQMSQSDCSYSLMCLSQLCCNSLWENDM